SEAQDGIRDMLVTRVQTCALPISPGRTHQRRGREPGAHRRTPPARLRPNRGAHRPQRTSMSSLATQLLLHVLHVTFLAYAVLVRSEERRVGRGGRAPSVRSFLTKR